MAQFERFETRGDSGRIFDGGEIHEDDEEGSRLPLLLVIGLLVVAAFAGVVWLAYTQGVERGRADAPRLLVGAAAGSSSNQSTSAGGLKVYQEPAPPEDEDVDSAPQPPTPVKPASTAVPGHGPLRMAQAMTTDKEPAPVEAQTPAPATPAQATNPPRSLLEPHPATAAGPKSEVAAPSSPPSTTLRAAPKAAAPVSKPAPTASAVSQAPLAPPASTPAVAGTGVLLQVGAYKSQADADAAWRTFQRHHPMTAEYQPDVKKVDLADKGVWYRLRMGPFADKSAASGFCEKLKADGGTCFLAR